MKLSKRLLAAAALYTGLISGVAQATPVSSQLFDGFNQLSGDGADYLINFVGGFSGGSATTLGVGDRLRGIFNIDTVAQSPASHALGGASGNGELTGVFDLVVTDKIGTPGAWAFTFGASGALDGYAPGAAVVFFDHAANNFSRVRVNPGDTAATLDALAMDGTAIFVMGLAAPGSWTATAVSDDVSVLGATPAPLVGGGYNASLDLLQNNSGRVLDQVACILPSGIGFVDMCVSGTLFGTAGANTPYDIFSNWDATIKIAPVPERETWAMLLAGLGLVGFARSKRRGAEQGRSGPLDTCFA